MKVAISLSDELSARADALARREGLNRSQLYQRALEQLLAQDDDDPVTRKLDELAAESAFPLSRASGRALIDAGRWEW